MDAEVVERVRAGFDESLPTAKGWGIGLISSKQRIESCSGYFGIESGVGKGTTVEVRLRAAPCEMSGEELRERVREYRTGEASRSQKPEIFLVDDDTEHNHSLSRILGLSGISVRAFESVGELINQLPQQAVPPIVCDINMPDGGAETLLSSIKERGIEAPLAIMSGDSQEEKLYYLAARGAGAFFSKPVVVEQMVEWVSSLTQPTP
jgi:CheY-like chemotaxis protein